MNINHDSELEAEISRQLRELPELEAPAALVGRVLAVVERRSRVPWYRRSWQAWPPALQVAAFVALAVLFAGLCVGGWLVSHSGPAERALQQAQGWWSGLDTVKNSLDLLVGAGIVFVKQLGSGALTACLVALGLGYALCVGLGTVYLRLAMAKR
jgi:hypothetical protein